MKVTTCLHIAYLILISGAMVLIAFGSYASGWSIFLLGILFWAVLLGLEIKADDINR